MVASSDNQATRPRPAGFKFPQIAQRSAQLSTQPKFELSGAGMSNLVDTAQAMRLYATLVTRRCLGWHGLELARASPNLADLCTMHGAPPFSLEIQDLYSGL